MSFISTGLRELMLKVRRQRTRLALKHEKRQLQKSEIALGREGTSEAARFPEVRTTASVSRNSTVCQPGVKARALCWIFPSPFRHLISTGSAFDFSADPNPK